VHGRAEGPALCVRHPSSDGIRVAVFYTKLHNRLLGPLLAADRPPASPQLRQALCVIDHQVDGYVQHARMASLHGGELAATLKLSATKET
jgi:hypothetical protein